MPSLVELADGKDRLVDVHDGKVHNEDDQRGRCQHHLLHAVEAQSMAIGGHSSKLMLVAPHRRYQMCRCK
eukprot:1986814-Heterocapsa_arctica.AAC.2